MSRNVPKSQGIYLYISKKSRKLPKNNIYKRNKLAKNNY